MNCIYCGKPIMEHEAGDETDKCVDRARGRRGIGCYTYYSSSYIYVLELNDYLTDPDGPVEQFDIRWAHDRERGSEYIIDVDHWVRQPDDVDSMSDFAVSASTLPLALCRAVLWLAAVEHEYAQQEDT